MAGYTQVFMPALGGFIISYFPMFLTGAIFGKLMTISGFAESIASWVARVVGARHAIFITALLSALFTYGGIDAWVVVFTVFPIAKSLFQQADIPKRLIPAAIATGPSRSPSAPCRVRRRSTTRCLRAISARRHSPHHSSG